jgi:hypothetical protein
VPATPITPAVRYFRPGTTKVVFAPAVVNKNSPTRAEINAGTDLSGDVAATEGWQPVSNVLDAPDLNSSFVSKVAGGQEVGDSTLTMYQSSNSVDVRSLLPRGTSGFILWFDEGDVSGRKADCFPITVGSLVKLRDLGDVAQLQVSFAVTSVPGENWTVPA